MKEKILVVDNHPLILRLMDNFLSKKGYEVKTAPDSLTALDVLSDFVPDIMFVDMVMPNIGGDKLCRIVRSMPELENVCIIILSAIAAEEKIDFASFGANACIAKGPFRDIEQHISRLLAARNNKEDFVSAGVVGIESVYQREITKELLISRKHFEVVLGNISEGIVECNSEGIVVYVNAAGAAILGAREEEILAANFFDFFAGSTRQEVRRIFAGLGERAIALGEETALLLKGRRVALVVLPIVDADQRTAVAIIQDITERKIAEEKLEGYRDHLEQMVVARTSELTQKNEQLHQEIRERRFAEQRTGKAQREWERTFDAVDDIVTLQDDSRRLTRVNKATCRIFQKTAEELVGRFCYEVFRGSSVPCSGCVAHFSSHDPKSYSQEFFHPELQKTFRVTATPVMDDQDRGKICGIAHFAKDISEQKRLECQLLQAQKMEAIGTLAGGIAHDFNNILAAVLGYTELVMMDMQPDMPAYTKLTQVAKAGKRARDLVAQILTFSRQSEARRQPLELRSIVKEAMKLLRASLPSTMEMKQEISDKPCWALADPVQIHQMLMNLCVNASHAMRGQEGVLLITLGPEEIDGARAALNPDLRPGAYIHLGVRDNGQGMEPNVAARIFDPFFTTKQPGEGTGMGLAVVHGIMKNHQGAIEVTSVPGQGTVFDLYFPRITEVEEICGASVDLPVSRGTERILFVDDEPSLVELGKQALGALGYRIQAFGDSREAWAQFIADPEAFDLIITDLTMPGMTGAQLAEKILALRPGIPVILTTGYSDIITEDEAREMGVQEYLLKPFSTARLAKMVRRVLDGDGQAEE
ncbi:MAG: response regulator [Desulfobulbaceae bacterium]|nr:response regulator [Desulfobulbaceae bacterium]HIJ89570.1 response regulator [Deltaproteobacteria bacterium]